MKCAVPIVVAPEIACKAEIAELTGNRVVPFGIMVLRGIGQP